MIRKTALLALAASALSLTACGGPRSLLAVQESGDRAYTRGEYDRAVAEYEEYVQRLPGDPIGRYNLGRAYLRVNQPVAAREQLFLAYSQRPAQDEYFEALAEALHAAGQRDELFRLLRQRATDRQRVSDYLLVARYAQQMGDADQAQQALRTASRLVDGQSLEVQLAFVDFYESVNDRTRALERLRMAYYLAPNDTTVVQRIRGYGEIPGPSFALAPRQEG